MTQSYPKELTSYDFLKAFAVIIMVIDHAGWFFFPDDPWWRAVGRIGFPVWFFLIGHASGRAIIPRLWGGALVLIAIYAVAGSHIFPLNALVTIILIRLALNSVMHFSLQSMTRFVMVCAILALLIVPSDYATEYGTQALIFAMAGYIVRHRAELRFSARFVTNVMLFCFFTFVISQFFMHGFSLPQFYAMAGGTAAVCLCLYRFRRIHYPQLTNALPSVCAAAVRFMGRRTLEVYVAHIVLFQVMAVMQGQERFGWFDWKLTPLFAG